MVQLDPEETFAFELFVHQRDNNLVRLHHSPLKYPTEVVK